MRFAALVGPAVIAVAAIALSSCSSSAKSHSASTAAAAGSSVASAAPATKAAGGGTGTTVAVTEKEFAIVIASKTLKAGSYTFKVTNNGSVQHNLTIDGPGVKDQASPTLDGGKSGDVTVTLQKGTYEFYCSVGRHKDEGMDIKMQVI